MEETYIYLPIEANQHFAGIPTNQFFDSHSELKTKKKYPKISFFNSQKKKKARNEQKKCILKRNKPRTLDQT